MDDGAAGATRAECCAVVHGHQEPVQAQADRIGPDPSHRTDEDVGQVAGKQLESGFATSWLLDA